MSLDQVQLGTAFYIGISENYLDGHMDESNPMLMSNDVHKLMQSLRDDAHEYGSSATAYLCVPIGKVDQSHVELVDKFQWLGRAAAAVDGGGDEALEGRTGS